MKSDPNHLDPDSISNHPVEGQLDQLFRMQSELNDTIYKSNDIRNSFGKVLETCDFILEIFKPIDHDLGPNRLVNEWLKRYADAMEWEIDELRESLCKKFWSKDKVDLQNVRVELIDILHFLISAMIVAGMTPESILQVYSQKHAINLKRQEEGYNKQSKTEEDNRRIEA